MRGEFDAQSSLSFRPRAGTLMFALQVAALADETRAKKKGKRREAASRRRQRAVDQQSVVTRSLQYRRCEWRRSDVATEKKKKKTLPRPLCSCICLFFQPVLLFMFRLPLPQVSAQQHRLALAENKGCRRSSRRRRPFFRGPVIARAEPRQAAARRERLIFVSLILFRFRFASSAHAALAVGLILVKKLCFVV